MVKPSGQRTGYGQPGRRGVAAVAAVDVGPNGDTEQRILKAAHAVFVRRGTAGARMQEIAREAGVNSALLHYYFRSKDRLAEAVFRRAAGDLMPAAIAILGSTRELGTKVRDVIDLELDHLSRTPFLPGYLIGELTHHPERARQLVSALTGMVPEDVGRNVLRTLGRQIEAAVAARRMVPMTPDQFVVNLLSLCIFPFAARPILMAVLGIDEKGFQHFIDRRRKELPRFFMGALRP